jgi:hypothetical protein
LWHGFNCVVVRYRQQGDDVSVRQLVESLPTASFVAHQIQLAKIPQMM